MKKILFLIPIFVLFFGSRSLAYSYNGVDYEYKYRVYNGDYVADLYCNDELCLCTQSGSTNNGGYRVYIAKDGFLYSVQFNYGTDLKAPTSYYPNTSGSVAFNFGVLSTSVNGNWATFSKNVEGYSQLQTFSTYQAAYEYLTTPRVDWNSPYYDPLMPVPEVEIKYNTADYSSGNTPIFPASVALTNADASYYVEVVMVNYMPSTVLVKYQDYSALMSHKFEQHNIIPAEMLKSSSSLSYEDIGDLAENAWSQDVVSYPISNVVFSNGISSDTGGVAAFENMKDLYATMRKIGLFYGNNTEFYFRYFVIDDSDRFVVSAWRTWSSSYSDSFGLAMPSYYKTYSSASGYENTDSNTSIVISPTSQPNVVNPSNNYGKKTGGLINIQIGSNVPNYPDYPTIATYNTDNLLVNAIDTAKQLPDFFTSSIAIFNGMFDGLLPEPFWGIIMTGFLFSIVIMIIKIL